MNTQSNTYSGEQYDHIEQLLNDAERLISNPNTRREGLDLHSLAKTRIQREINRLNYAKLTDQMPNVPPLEPGPKMKRLCPASLNTMPKAVPPAPDSKLLNSPRTPK